MKTALLFLIYLSIAWGVEIQNFNSSGVYFQHMGTVKVGKGSLEYVNVVNLFYMENYLRYLLADFNSYQSLSPGYSSEHRNIVENMIEQIEAVKKEPLPEVEYGIANKNMLSNMVNEVKNFINLTNSTRNELKLQTPPKKNKMKALKDQFEMIMDILDSKEYHAKLLSFSTFKEDFNNLGISGSPLEVFRKLKEMSVVTKTKSSDNQIYISLVINFLNDEAFNLWKVISLPIIKNSNVITLQNNFKFLLTSPDAILGSRTNLGKTSYFNGIQVLSGNQGLAKLKDNSCLAGIFKGDLGSIAKCDFSTSFENIEIFEDLGGYRYLFAIRDRTTYTYTCPGMDHNINQEDYIQGTGILTLNEGCRFKTEDTNLVSVKVDAVIEHKDKYMFTSILDRMMETLNTQVIKEPPLLIPLTKVTTNLDSFYERSRKIEQKIEEANEIIDRINNRPMPTKTSSWFDKF
ncbi:hypothetical protein ACFFRR_008936 [Megaselia abdita]